MPLLSCSLEFHYSVHKNPPLNHAELDESILPCIIRLSNNAIVGILSKVIPMNRCKFRVLCSILQHAVCDGEELSATLPTKNYSDHPVSAVHDCFFDVSTDMFRIWNVSSSWNLNVQPVMQWRQRTNLTDLPLKFEFRDTWSDVH
jgi:hypothetical protein